MTTHDPFTRGSAVTILPGVPLDGVPTQRTESPAPEAPEASVAQAPEAPQFPAAPPAYAPVVPPLAPPAAGLAPAAAPVPTATPVPPAGVQLPPPAAALPPAGPAYVPQAQAFPAAPVFDADIPAAPAVFPMDVPAAPVAAPIQASPFMSTPAPAFPPADAVTAFPPQHAPLPGAPFQPALTQATPLPELTVIPEDKQSKTGKRRKEGGVGASPVKAVALGAVVLGLAAGWFGHGALSGSDSGNNAAAPVVTHAPVSHVVRLSSVSALGSLHALPKPWVTTGQQALLSSSVVSSTTPVYFGGGSHGTFADLGVSVGTLSKVAASRGAQYPAGPGGGTVRCGINVIEGQAVSWCTWKDAKSSGMLARFAAPTTIEAYRSTQLVRQTLEP